MENASKNAGEMMGKLQMEFNRKRQAQITNDLVDIVTGEDFPSLLGIYSSCDPQFLTTTTSTGANALS